MNYFFPQSAGRDRSGFTLIEVLIGVIVLGLGLLGLASIFPAVVVQQRQAADAVQGDSASKSVESFMRASSQLNEPFAGAFDRVRIDDRFSAPLSDDDNRTRWEIGTPDRDTSDALTLDTGEGTLTFTVPESANNIVEDVRPYFGAIDQRIAAVGKIDISQVMRLYPSPKFRNTDGQTPQQQSLLVKNDGPQFVWDMALRRDKGTSGNENPLGSDAVQVALFVRRIDPGIRGDLNTVFDPASTRPVFAVAENIDGEPTLDGRRGDSRYYSPIRRAQLSVYQPPAGTEQARNRVVFVAGSVADVADEIVRAWLPRTGQKFVGPQGQVWTVLSVRAEGAAGESQGLVMTLDGLLEDSFDPSGRDPVEILFTMHTPANVRVFSISAPQRAAYGATN